jgi:transposase
MNAEFIARMEAILALYVLPYDAKRPVLCFDERPCFLIGEAVTGFAMKSGTVKKEHYAYEKNGSCSVLATIEPKTGKRIAEVCSQRRKVEFAQHLQKVANEYAKAEKIILILDNLNTHQTSSFYETFPAAEARRLTEKFEFHYTPKSASWLNMIEIEFSALSRLCLNRRIATQAELESEVLAIVKERSKKGIKIDWQFSIDLARQKLNRHYAKLHSDNIVYQQT